jgi:hypothetical protein
MSFWSRSVLELLDVRTASGSAAAFKRQNSARAAVEFLFENFGSGPSRDR